MENYIQYLSENKECLSEEEIAQVDVKKVELRQLEQSIEKSINEEESDIQRMIDYQDELDFMNDLELMKEITSNFLKKLLTIYLEEINEYENYRKLESDKSKKNPNGETKLHLAAKEDNVQYLKELIKLVF